MLETRLNIIAFPYTINIINNGIIYIRLLYLALHKHNIHFLNKLIHYQNSLYIDDKFSILDDKFYYADPLYAIYAHHLYTLKLKKVFLKYRLRKPWRKHMTRKYMFKNKFPYEQIVYEQNNE